MKITREDKGNVIVLRLEGKLLGGSDSDTMRGVVLGAIEDGKHNVVVDLEKVSLANSAGLGILMSNLTTLRRNEGTLKLLNVPKRIGSALQTTWLNRVFELYSDEGDALSSFES